VANRSAALPLLKHDSCFVRSGIVTQAWALKVSDVPGATHNRIGSNRYRHRSAGAGVGSPGRDAGSGQTWRSRELVFLHRGPRVRISLPPPASQCEPDFLRLIGSARAASTEVSARYARSPWPRRMGAPERRGLRVFCHAAANVMVSSQQEMGPRPRAGRLERGNCR
jgi:hypothetical protein